MKTRILALPLLLFSFLYVQELNANTIGIHAIVLSDDDGQRSTNLPLSNLTNWINWANQVWNPAGIQFEFDKNSDLEYLNDTLLNKLDENSPEVDQERERGIEIASQYPNKIVLFFRYGPLASPSGSAFSNWDINFIAMPGDSLHCGQFNKAMLAHEIGHYLGLSHVFSGIYETMEDAEQAFIDSNNNVNFFDGDGFEDTPPDPLITSNECPDVTNLTLNGVEFNLPRNNLMAYYFHDVVDQLSQSQIERANWFLNFRIDHQMKMINENNPQNPIEAELISNITTYNSSSVVQDVSGFLFPDTWSNNKQIFLGNQSNGVAEMSLHTDKAGYYFIDLFASMAPDFGKFRFLVNGIQLEPIFDAYSPVVIPSGRIRLGGCFLNNGENQFRVEVIGKNENSTGYNFGVDCFELTFDEPSLTRAIFLLKIMTESEISEFDNTIPDINRDGKLGIEELIYNLQE